jgi:hypothetical protein
MDARLTEAVLIHGQHDWARIGRELGIDRNVCRVRWFDAISNLNRFSWKEEEEEHLSYLVEQQRSAKVPWTFIAASLGTGRTAKQCQYRYGVVKRKRDLNPPERKPLVMPIFTEKPKAEDIEEEQWSEGLDWQLGTLL